ncbi:DMT family transporter [Ornithinimicrobium tianjinense]|uniref:Multidrug DMT transporter permease n=1 Tax=Ornithinimicrobium tianjinense TaxID=1195761 RepID=A0A917BUN5_9MICO|nr:DMT family transporter [Ornithinimicrobium tianjinense]GGF58051.1 multidrug DMT transporter permease [Ornithinimicrobium tianjinense]
MPPVLLLVLATLFWAGNFTVGEVAVRSVDPLSLTWLRWTLAAVPLLLVAHVVERPDWRAVARRWPALLALGVLGMSGYPMLLYASLERTSAVSASVINAINPAVMVVLAVLVGMARAGWRTWAGVGVGLLGVLLVLSRGDLGVLLALRLNSGDLIMLVAVVVWSAYTLASQRLGLPALSATALQVLLAALVLTPFALAAGVLLPQDGPTWGAVAYIVVFPSIGAYLCWNHAVPRVSPGAAGTSMNLITVFVMLLAAFLGRPPTPVQVLGAVLVVGGVLLATPRGGGRARHTPRGVAA